MKRELFQLLVILVILTLSSGIIIQNALAGKTGSADIPDMPTRTQTSYDMPVQSAQVPSHEQVVQPMANARTAWEQQGTLGSTTYQNNLAERQDLIQRRYGGGEGINRVAEDAGNPAGGAVEAYTLWNSGQGIDRIIVEGNWQIKDGKIYTAEGNPSSLQLNPNMFKGDRQVEVVFANGVKTQAYTTPGTELMPFALPAGDSVQLSRSNGAGARATDMTPAEPAKPTRAGATRSPTDTPAPEKPAVTKQAEQPTPSLAPIKFRPFNPSEYTTRGFGGMPAQQRPAAESPCAGGKCRVQQQYQE